MYGGNWIHGSYTHEFNNNKVKVNQAEITENIKKERETERWINQSSTVK